MANLRDARLRMKAIRQTLKVTRAMNLISTSKLRKGRQILADTEPFFYRIQKSILEIYSGAGSFQSEFFARSVKKDGQGRQAIIVVTSDKGLAGGYNANVERAATALAETLENPVVIPIGTIGTRFFSSGPLLTLENFSFRSRMPELDDAQEIADYLISQYQWGVFGEAHIVFTRMKSAVKLIPESRQILPLDLEKMKAGFAAQGEERQDLKFEYLPSAEAVFDTLVPMWVKGIIYGALVESYVSEQSSRMSAMDEASKNAQDMLDKLQIHYNRARQAGITQEMTEIIGGSSALAQ